MPENFNKAQELETIIDARKKQREIDAKNFKKKVRYTYDPARRKMYRHTTCISGEKRCLVGMMSADAANEFLKRNR